MNLITKLKRFMHLRAKGVSMKVALREFNHPLTTSDKYALTLIACIVGISVTLSYKREIDDSANQHRLSTIEAIKREAIASEKLYSVYSEKQHIERVLVSALNGAVIENGRKVTMCRIGASGECK